MTKVNTGYESPREWGQAALPQIVNWHKAGVEESFLQCERVNMGANARECNKYKKIFFHFKKKKTFGQDYKEVARSQILFYLFFQIFATSREAN